MKLIYILLILGFTVLHAKAIEKKSAVDTALSTVLKGRIPGLKDGDQIKLTISDYYIGLTHTASFLTAKVKNERFSFDLSTYHIPIYVNIELPNITGVDKAKKDLFSYRTNFLVKPNDQVELTVEQNDLFFTGKSANAYNIQYGLSKMVFKERQKDAYIDFTDVTKIKDIFKSADAAQKVVLQYLDDKKGFLDDLTYHTIKYNFILETGIEKYFILNFKKIKASDAGVPPIGEINIDSIYAAGLYTPNLIPQFVEAKFKYDSCTYFKRPYKRAMTHTYFKNKFSGKLRDYLLVYPIVENLKTDSLAKYTKLALSEVEDERLKAKLIELTSGLMEGQMIEDVSFHDAKGNLHHLSEYRGKVILLDFWFTGCMGCKEITPYLNKVAATFENEKVVFLSISIDKNTDLWKRSIKEGSYSFANSTKLITSNQGQDHPAIKRFKIIGYPTLIILDKEGRLVRSPVDPRVDDCRDLMGLIREKLK
jgi:thiol-disulfide isomerase/thioredoxin